MTARTASCVDGYTSVRGCNVATLRPSLNTAKAAYVRCEPCGPPPACMPAKRSV